MFTQLLERWEKAFDEFELISQYRSAAKTFKYTTGICFDLKNYTKAKFPAGKSLTDTASDDRLPYLEFGLEASGRPCYQSFPPNSRVSKWEGYYTYQEDLVEYVEFSSQTRVPSRINRVLFEDGWKIAYQHIYIGGNETTPAYIDLPKEEIISPIKSIKQLIQFHIEEYEYDQDKIVKAECFGTAHGRGDYKFQKIYSYDKAGKLDEIWEVYSDGSSRLSYAKPVKKSDVQQLSDQLAGLIAEAVVDTLVKNKVEAPVAMVALCYQTVYTYLPRVSSRPESLRQEILAEGGEHIWEDLFLGYYDSMSLDKTKFERLFEQFMQTIKKTQDYELGTTMLRKAAALLTSNKLMGKIPVGEEFFTYAVDNATEGHSKEEFIKILRECGMEDTVLEAWDKRGWLRPE